MSQTSAYGRPATSVPVVRCGWKTRLNATRVRRLRVLTVRSQTLFVGSRINVACGMGGLFARLGNIGAWRSLVARLNGVQKVGGSNPLAPTTKRKWLV